MYVHVNIGLKVYRVYEVKHAIRKQKKRLFPTVYNKYSQQILFITF